MRRGLLVLLALVLLPVPALAQSDGRDEARALTYTLRPVPRGAGLVLEVEMEFTGDAGGETTLTLPSSWGGRERLYEGIRELRALSPRTAVRGTGRAWVKQQASATSSGSLTEIGSRVVRRRQRLHG
jgi:hypothetical protein